MLLTQSRLERLSDRRSKEEREREREKETLVAGLKDGGGAVAVK
jgi:hypothetical protein